MDNGYHSNGSSHHPVQGNGTVPVPPPTSQATATTTTTAGVASSHHPPNTGMASYGADESSTLDHALLETLFYNEMMMLDSPSPPSASFIAQNFPDPSHEVNIRYPPMTDTDAKTIAEKEMLRDFGVTASPYMQPSTAPAASRTTETWDPLPPAQASVEKPRYAQSTTQHTQYTHAPIYHAPAPGRAPAAQLAPAAPVHVHTNPPAHGQGHVHAHSGVSSSTTATNPSSSAYPGQPVHPTPQPPPPAAVAVASALRVTAPRPNLSMDGPIVNQLSQDRASQLVDQFATLASRFGIDLPESVSKTLLSAAAIHDPKLPPADLTIKPIPLELQQQEQKQEQQDEHATQKEDKSKSLEEGDGTMDGDIAPTVEELRKTAEEAIAAVTNKKRPTDDDSVPPKGSTSAPEPAVASLSSTASVPSSKAVYSKRRKKPRLSDCESRLAELKAENELLKRHLQNVSNKAHRFDQEKEEAGKRIQKLHDENAGPEEMNKAVQEFSEMYSDYGVNRQQELNFHLDQLQRLVNPTNFTKMGLWTLGQNSSDPKRNPIAGILQKELDITPQQGRKILDQREKIRALCDNLKECLSLLAKLRSLCAQKTRIFHDRMNKCREILTSQQVVKLIIWINEHTQLIETVCPGWGTEHIHSKLSRRNS